jgi:hypothetical protein
MSTTQVDKKDLPDTPQIKLINAPDTVEDALKRIMELEMILEDLSRACEIASMTQQFDMIESFRLSAEQTLAGKIQIEQPTFDNFKLTVVEGSISQETQDAINKEVTSRSKVATDINNA